MHLSYIEARRIAMEDDPSDWLKRSSKKIDQAAASMKGALEDVRSKLKTKQYQTK